MRRRFLLPFFTVALGLGVGLAITEAALRLAGFSNRPTSQRDDYCGTIRRPGVEYFHSEEGGALVRFNTAGFRDREWALAKPPNTFRIAVLGDSYVEAGQVALDERFTDIFGEELERSSALDGRRVEVMTFGISGFGTAQELMCLRQYVWPYSPDMVLLAVTTGNDVRNNSKTLQRDNGRPYFSYVDGHLTLDASFRESPAHRRAAWTGLALAVIDRSRAAQAAFRFWQKRSSRERRMLTRQAAAAHATGEEAGLDSWIYREPVDPVHEEAWQITEGLFGLMNREVTERGARFVLVTLSNGIQVHPDSAVREAFKRRLGVPDLFYPERRIAAVGQREGFPVVNLAPLLYEDVQKTGRFLHGFGERPGAGHWNQFGHREVGRHLSEQVASVLGGEGRNSVAHRSGAGGGSS